MNPYDQRLFDAKTVMTRAVLALVSKNVDVDDLTHAADALDRAWDAVADTLNRRIDVRDSEIRSLLNQIAELRK